MNDTNDAIVGSQTQTAEITGITVKNPENWKPVIEEIRQEENTNLTLSLAGFRSDTLTVTNLSNNTVDLSFTGFSDDLNISNKMGFHIDSVSGEITGNSVFFSGYKGSTDEQSGSFLGLMLNKLVGNSNIKENKVVLTDSNVGQLTAISGQIEQSGTYLFHANTTVIGGSSDDLELPDDINCDFGPVNSSSNGDDGSFKGILVLERGSNFNNTFEFSQNHLIFKNIINQTAYSVVEGIEISAPSSNSSIKFLNNYVSIENVKGGEDSQVEVVGIMGIGHNMLVDGVTLNIKDSNLLSVLGSYVIDRATNGPSVTNQVIRIEDSTVKGVVGGSLALSNFVTQKSTTLELRGINSIGNIAAIGKFNLSVANENAGSVKNAILTLTNHDEGYGDTIDASMIDVIGSDAIRNFNQLELQISSNEKLDTTKEYFLIATTDESAKYTFKDLTIKTASTFVEKSKTVDQLEVNKDNPLTTESAVLEGLLETESENIGVEVKATENSKTLSESLLGTVAFINQGAEFIADEGLAAMVDSATIGQVATFGAVHGGTSNYNTGSRVDVDGYTLATGMSYKVSPNWVIGGFIEAGWADSDSHVNVTKGEGDHDYYGIGFATRYSFDNNFYVDGSLRLGQASTEFTGLYAQDSAKYDSDAFYTTAHVGAGYVMPLTDTINLDMYGRYVLSYLDSDKVDLHNKYHDKLDMDSTVTHAVRVGGRLTGSFCSYADWKLGLAYEHVFDGDAESAVNSLNLEVPSLEGDTGVMELGVSMRPSQNSPWRVDIGAKGYAGDREGVTGNATVRYIF